MTRINIDPADRILVVGGSGFIGKHLSARLSCETSAITCLGLKGAAFQAGGKAMEVLHADLSIKSQVAAALSGRSFEYVFNLGGYIEHTPYFSGGREIIEAHFRGLLNLIDNLDRERLKGFVQIGSSDEYGNAFAPQKENMREDPISSYSAAKVAATHFVQMLHRAEGFPGVVLRPFLVYGRGQDDKRFLPQVIKACLKNEEFKVSEGMQLRDFCHVDDIVEAMIAASVSPSAKGHVVNIGSGEPVSIRAVIEKVMRLTGGGRPQWGAHPYRQCENMALYADIGLAGVLLGWSPVKTLEEGLLETINYYKQFNAEIQ